MLKNILNQKVLSLVEQLEAEYSEYQKKIEEKQKQLKAERSSPVSRAEILRVFKTTVEVGKKRFIDKMDDLIDSSLKGGFEPGAGVRDIFFNFATRTADHDALNYFFGDRMLEEISKRIEPKIPAHVRATFADRDKRVAAIEAEIAELTTKQLDVRATIGRLGGRD